MALRRHPILRRSLAILALIGIVGVAFALATIHTIPPRALTLTAMDETESRIDIYVAGGENKPPPSLDMLPKRAAYVNRTTDGWNRPLIYAVGADDTFTLTSLGRDGAPGGTGDDVDVMRKYQVTHEHVPHVKPAP